MTSVTNEGNAFCEFFADQANPFSPIKFEDARFENCSAGSPADVGLRKEHAGQDEVKLDCAFLAKFIAGTGELLQCDILRSLVISADNLGYI